MCKVLSLWQVGLIANIKLHSLLPPKHMLFLYSKRYAFPLVDKG